MISKDVEYWLRIIEQHMVKECIANRDIFIWGAYSKGLIIKKALEEQGYTPKGFIDSYKIEYQGRKVYHPEEVLKLSPKPFIFVAIEIIRDSIVSFLSGNGFEKGVDYIYFTEMIPEIVIEGFRGKYEDVYGNVFQYKGASLLDNVKIICKGNDNSLTIGKNFGPLEGGQGRVTIKLSYGGAVLIGDNVHFNGSLVIDATFGGCVKIGNAYQAESDSVIDACNGGKVIIGEKVSSGKRLFISGGELRVGDDCMISHDVSIIGTNSHSIFNLDDGVSISKTKEKPIVIADHVWLGKDATVLYGSTVGKGSVVGANSVAKGEYPCNSIIAGNIARVIRTNCTWDRRKNIEFCEL